MQPTVVGLFVGLILGLALAFEGFGAMLIVAFCGAAGFIVVKVVQGEIDLTPYIGGDHRPAPGARPHSASRPVGGARPDEGSRSPGRRAGDR